MNLSYTVPDEKKIRVIIDTDTACEADDPFAIAHALMSPKLIVRAIIAEHFAQEGSMMKSYHAIMKLADAMDLTPHVLYGEEWPLDSQRNISQGVQYIIDEARREDTKPLYVLCMGAVTNVACALKAAPDISDRFTVVSIGGRAYEKNSWEGREFNYGNDADAANAVLQSDVAFWQIPISAYATMQTGLAELQLRVSRCGKAGKYLYEQMVAYNQTKQASWTPGESWSLGDSPSVAVVLNPNCGRSKMIQPRHVNPDTSYADPFDGRQIKVFESVDSRYVLEDFFAKLELNYGS